MIPDFISSRDWIFIAAALVATSLLALIWSYARSSGPRRWRLGCFTLRATAIGLIGFCLVEPVQVYEVPRTGANLLFVLADSSRSLQIMDEGSGTTREEQVRQSITGNQAWLNRLDETFDLRKFVFDQEIESSELETFEATGTGSGISRSLNEIAERFRNRPAAGIILLTDGNDTAPVNFELAGLPAVYPVVVGSNESIPDTGIVRVSTSQTNFEAAPVTIAATVESSFPDSPPLVVELFKPDGTLAASQSVTIPKGKSSADVRFQFAPDTPGISDYRLRVSISGQAANGSGSAKTSGLEEATLANNERPVVVDRVRGPHRILYVSGRPNWEFKFLRRALQEDDEIDLVGLIRIARQEPKFAFRSRRDSANPLFSGFDESNAEDSEQYDEPVLTRIGTSDADELRGGFPSTADELFAYQAIILDDVEAAFFTQEQFSLMEKFVSQRGGGLLMLGGQESFFQGNYHRTALDRLLPVYLDRSLNFFDDTGYQLELTREGWLQPWVRLEPTETEEHGRLAAMPGFLTLNPVPSVKPGASVLADVVTAGGQRLPALVAQRFGRGRTLALMIGDLWQWRLNSNRDSDLYKAWRQTIRWLVADVPRRVEVKFDESEANGQTIPVQIQVVDRQYLPSTNAKITAVVTRPDGEKTEIPVRPSDTQAGIWELNYAPRQQGVYRLEVVARETDGTQIGKREAAWVSDLDAREFARLQPDRDYLQRIADQTGGEVVELQQLESLAERIPARSAPLMDRKTRPWWHNSWIFSIAIGLLIAEWGLRRWHGMA
jgi:uncharacterized membrane protein